MVAVVGVVELPVALPVVDGSGLVVPVVVAVVVAVDPSRRCMTGGASELSEFTVVSAEVSADVLVELVVLWVVEVDAGREGSGQVLDCDAFGDVLAVVVFE